MKKNLLYFFIVLLSALLIDGIAFSEDRQPRYNFREQDISEIGNFKPIEGKDTNIAVSIHHTGSTIHSGKYFLSLDLNSLRREAEMEVIYKNACENPISLNVVAVLKMVLDECTYLKGLKSYLDSVETKVEEYRRKYKLRGELGFAEQDHNETSDSASQYSENIFSNLLPKRISWSLSSDLNSNYLKGEVNIGNYFSIKANWGSDSYVRAMFTFPF